MGDSLNGGQEHVAESAAEDRQPQPGGVSALLQRPLIFPPLVLLSILIAQHFSGDAVGASGDRLSGWAYVFFAAFVPLVLLVAGLFAFRLQLRAGLPHPDPNVARWNWRLELGAVAVALLVVIAALAIEILRFTDSSAWLDQNGGIAAIAFDVALIVWILLFIFHAVRRLRRALWPREGIEYRTISNAIEAFGSTFALALIVGAAFAYYAATDYDPSATLPTGNIARATGPPGIAASVLAYRFAPVLIFDKDERWLPIPITSLETLKPGIRVRDTDASAPRLVAASLLAHIGDQKLGCRSAVPCYQVDLRRFAGQDCRPNHEEPVDLPPCAAIPTVYARVLRRGGDPARFPTDGRRSKRISTVIEYWLFYAYDKWERRTPLGLLTQRHDGDWEVLIVALRGPAPAWVAYSSHCGGVVESWSRVHVAGETHPYDWVAEGSHANYPTSGPQTPDWLGCSRTKHSGASVRLINALSNIRDRVDARGRGKIPIVLPVETEPRLDQPFWWGTVDKTSIDSPIPGLGDLATGTGPESPRCKPLWREPLGTIYCDKRWDTSDILHRSTDQFCSRWKTTGLDCGAA